MPTKCSFSATGLIIPERLLQAHEDGRVVFFCDAGISYPALLPGFSGLVKRLYQALSVELSLIQQAAIKAGQFDTAIGLLESDVVGGRETVRCSLATIITPDLTSPNAMATHEALLMLAQNRKGRTRIITTNFDRLFEEVKVAKSLSFPGFKAPLLPLPKTKWDGLVYLHGLLPLAPTTGDLDPLVVSSGDFGLAYLTERWAARLVSELFRNFHCLLCRLQYQRPGAALHDGCSGRRPSAVRIAARDVRLRQLFQRQRSGSCQRMEGEERHTHSLPRAPAPRLST